MKQIPSFVGKICMLADGWIVGSSAHPSADTSAVRDWDVLIPFSKWGIAAGMIPTNAVPNTFGGWKIKLPDCVVDVWPGDLGQHLATGTSKVVWHFSTDKRFTID